MYRRHETGKKGESYAIEFLQDKAYTIIERNFHCKTGEIDIIAFDNKKEELVFIEVKTRNNFEYGTPIEAVNNRKQNHIINVAKYYEYIHKLKNVYIRFDVIEVFMQNDKPYKLNQIKQVF